MPSTEPLPTVPQLLRAFGAKVGAADPSADLHRGSHYDVFGAGIGALVFRRLAERDRELFKGVYRDQARGDQLDGYNAVRYPTLPRVAGSRGAGTAYFKRASAGAGSGTIWAGTRVEVLKAGTELRTYTVTTDTPVSASALEAPVDITAATEGVGSAVHTQGDAAYLIRIADPLWDTTWTVNDVVCADGTDAEKDESWNARIDLAVQAAIPGVRTNIEQACKDAGAVYVAMFDSAQVAALKGYPAEAFDLDGDGQNDDYAGLNYIVVGDGGFNDATASISQACLFELEHWRVLGCALQVLPMVRTVVTMSVTIHMWDDVGKFDVGAIRRRALGAIHAYFDDKANAFLFRYPALRATIQRVVQDTRSIDFATTPSEPAAASLFGTVPVPRYVIDDAAISIVVAGPV